MKVIEPVLQQEDIKDRFGQIYGVSLIQKIKNMERMYRPFWLGRTDFEGRGGGKVIYGSVVFLGDARVPRIGILGIWKQKILTKFDLRCHSVDFVVVDRVLEDAAALLSPVLTADKVKRQLESPFLLRLISRLNISAVKLIDTDMTLVFRPYWKVLYKNNKSDDTALFAADGVLLRKYV